MVQPTPPQQKQMGMVPSPEMQAYRAQDAANQAQRGQMMQQRSQQRMGQISGNPYSQQLSQEDRRMEAMRRLQQMNLGG